MKKPRSAAPLPQGVIALLEAVLRGHQDQPDAACIGHHGLFDVARFSDDPAQASAATSTAARICGRCPELACTERLQASEAPGKVA